MKVYGIIHNIGSAVEWTEKVVGIYKDLATAKMVMKAIAATIDCEVHDKYLCVDDDMKDEGLRYNMVGYEIKEYDLEG